MLTYDNLKNSGIPQKYIQWVQQCYNGMIDFNNIPEIFEYLSPYGKNISLPRAVIDSSYVWIVKNGVMLKPNLDYKLNLDLTSVYLDVEPIDSDKFAIITFSNNIVVDKFAFMQFKDMLNRVHYKRLNKNKCT